MDAEEIAAKYPVHRLPKRYRFKVDHSASGNYHVWLLRRGWHVGDLRIVKKLEDIPGAMTQLANAYWRSAPALGFFGRRWKRG